MPEYYTLKAEPRQIQTPLMRGPMRYDRDADRWEHGPFVVKAISGMVRVTVSMDHLELLITKAMRSRRGVCVDGPITIKIHNRITRVLPGDNPIENIVQAVPPPDAAEPF